MTPRWSEVTALFGGTFDPPHMGHLQAVEGLFQNPGIKDVVVIPSGDPPLKKTSTNSLHRLKMAQICFKSLSNVKVHPIEIENSQRGLSYSFNTISKIRTEFSSPDGSLIAFVVGQDQIPQFHHWHRFPEILELCHWIILKRKTDPHLAEENLFNTLRTWKNSGLIERDVSPQREWKLKNGHHLILVDTPAVALSSSELRQELEKTGFVPPQDKIHLKLLPEVGDYLKQHRLYGT